MSTQLIFKSHVLETIEHDGKQWFTAATLASALEYSRGDKITQIYNRNSDEFTPCMSINLKMRFNGINNSLREKDVRIFSLRGAHLVAMFATTPVAKEFRRWVLDIMDREAEKSAIPPQPHIQPQFTAEEIILLCYMQLWMEKAQDLSKHLYPIMKELNSSYTNKLYDIAFETIYMVTKNRDALLREVTRLDMSSSVIQRAMPMLKSLRARQFEF
ncbi:phage antirepressor protein [Escherichia coli]|uniref:BRO family protein n=1 Tax=Escherichia coli TaxID=562 RepID=UPI000A8993A2|nr:BRO family protein [Escherichia coli]GDW66271.1 phage antirepressor protein [Escherichia coli]